MDVPGVQTNGIGSTYLNVTIQVALGDSCCNVKILPFSCGPRAIVGEMGRSVQVATTNDSLKKTARIASDNDRSASTNSVGGIDAWRGLI